MVLAHNTMDQRTEDVKINNDITFQTMMLSKPILDGLTSAGFYEPSPIQLLGIPLGKLGLDLILEAKSGTGKTVVFSTIALEKINCNEGLQVLIVTPTREIAAQICDVLKMIGSHIKGLKVEMIIGGLSFKDDLEKLKNNVHILVGTPGRLICLIKEKHIKTSNIHLLILDEADKLMESSFEADILYIHYALPRVKQIILSSATYPDSIDIAVKKLVQNPHLVCPDSSKILLGISHKVTLVKYNSNSVRQTEIRFLELTKLLSEIQFKQCIIFCNYQARVMQLHKLLTKAKWPAELVYGKQQQKTRLEALKTLQEYRCRILISTNLLSRGIDSKNVDLVINFEPPDTFETYLHRIGRSGRYGSIGMAISIVCEGKELNSFNQTLEPIMYAIKMKLFWSGDKLIDITKSNQQNDQMSSTTEVKLNMLAESGITDNNETLWKSSSYEPRLENFDHVCSSYNSISSTAKIESFSDLLEDFAKFDTVVPNECESSTYREIEFDDLSSQNSLDSVSKLKECNSNTKDVNTLKDEDYTQEKRKTTEIESFAELLEDFAKMNNAVSNECESPTYVKIKFDNFSTQNSLDSINKLSECNSNIDDVNTLKEQDSIPEKNKTTKIESFAELLEDFAKMKSAVANECESSKYITIEFDNPSSQNGLDSFKKPIDKLNESNSSIKDTSKYEGCTPGKCGKNRNSYNGEPNLSKLLNENVEMQIPKAFSTTKFNKGNKNQTKYLNKCVNSYTTKENIQSTTNYRKTNHKFTNIGKVYSNAHDDDDDDANTCSEAGNHNSEYLKKEQEYNKWYNQLKTRMKQIEQILYMEEMTK